MKAWSIGKRVGLTCMTLVAIAIGIGLINIGSGQITSQAIRKIETESLAGVEDLTTIQALALEFRGTSLLMGTPGLSAQYKAKQTAHLDELQTQITARLNSSQRTAISQEELKLYRNLRKETDAFLATCAQFRQLSSDGKIQEAGAFWSDEGSLRSKAFRKALQDEVDFNKDQFKKHVNTSVTAAHISNVLTCVLLALCVSVSGTLGLLVLRSINRALSHSATEIRTSAEQVTNAAAEVAITSQQLAQGASRQAATLEETSASGHEISAVTQRNTENSRTAVDLMAGVGELISKANQKLQLMAISMSEITESSARIERIIRTVEEIAFQTNILSLNAAVEAARAGEAGMGFAVVADEVRNLAQRCAQATEETTSLIEESVRNATAGNERLRDVTVAIRGITENSEKARMLVEEVNHSAHEQSRGIDQISQALIELEKVTQKTAAGAEESASASHQMKAQADAMNEIVLGLEILTWGK